MSVSCEHGGRRPSLDSVSLRERVAALAGAGEHRTIARFLIVGLSNTAISFVIFIAALKVLGGSTLGIACAQAASYGGGLVWSFVWNRSWSFSSENPVGAEAARFVVTQLAMLVLSMALVTTFVDALQWRSDVGWLAGVSIVTVANFLLLRLWVFRPRTE